MLGRSAAWTPTGVILRSQIRPAQPYQESWFTFRPSGAFRLDDVQWEANIPASKAHPCGDRAGDRRARTQTVPRGLRDAHGACPSERHGTPIHGDGSPRDPDARRRDAKPVLYPRHIPRAAHHHTSRDTSHHRPWRAIRPIDARSACYRARRRARGRSVAAEPSPGDAPEDDDHGRQAPLQGVGDGHREQEAGGHDVPAR